MVKKSLQRLGGFLTVCIFGLFMAGCGGGSGSTTKAVKASDIIGAWQTEYQPTPNAQAIFTFQADGTFTQVTTIRGASKALETGGKWKFDGEDMHQSNNSAVYLEGIKTFDSRGWQSSNTFFLVVDSEKRPGALALSGSLIGDPDAYLELTRVSSTVTPTATNPSGSN